LRAASVTLRITQMLQFEGMRGCQQVCTFRVSLCSPDHYVRKMYEYVHQIHKIVSAQPLPLYFIGELYVQDGSNMTGTNCDLFTHNQSRSYLNHLVLKNE
jgi:hypothetical protein